MQTDNGTFNLSGSFPARKSFLESNRQFVAAGTIALALVVIVCIILGRGGSSRDEHRLTRSHLYYLPEPGDGSKLTLTLTSPGAAGNAASDISQVVLPEGSDLIVGTYDSTSFTCVDGDGFHKDPNNCPVFHVCLPPANGQLSVQQFSFICTGDAGFELSSLKCLPKVDVAACNS